MSYFIVVEPFMALTCMKFYKPYKNLRLKNYDYHNGYFFITNKTNNSIRLLIGDDHALVKEALFQLVKRTPGVSVDFLMLMPDHIHVILIFNNCELNLSEFWRRFKAVTTLKLKKSGAIIDSLWQRNYYEHIIRNEIALQRIRKYIEANPYKENLPLREMYEDIRHDIPL